MTDEDYSSGIRNASRNIFQHNSLQYSTKEYYIELKPLFSTFGLKSLAVTSLRSFLLFYLPLLEPRSNIEEDDDDFLQDAPEEHHVDLVAHSVKRLVKVYLINQQLLFINSSYSLYLGKLILLVVEETYYRTCPRARIASHNSQGASKVIKFPITYFPLN